MTLRLQSKHPLRSRPPANEPARARRGRGDIEGKRWRRGGSEDESRVSRLINGSLPNLAPSLDRGRGRLQVHLLQ